MMLIYVMVAWLVGYGKALLLQLTADISVVNSVAASALHGCRPAGACQTASRFGVNVASATAVYKRILL